MFEQLEFNKRRGATLAYHMWDVPISLRHEKWKQMKAQLEVDCNLQDNQPLTAIHRPPAPSGATVATSSCEPSRPSRPSQNAIRDHVDQHRHDLALVEGSSPIGISKDPLLDTPNISTASLQPTPGISDAIRRYCEQVPSADPWNPSRNTLSLSKGKPTNTPTTISITQSRTKRNSTTSIAHRHLRKQGMVDCGLKTSFLFLVNELPTNDAVEKQYFQGHWLPPIQARGFLPQQAGYVYRWKNGAISYAAGYQWVSKPVGNPLYANGTIISPTGGTSLQCLIFAHLNI